MDKKNFFDGIAEDWEKEHRIAKERERVKKIFKYFNISEGNRVFDAGCGTGRLAPLINEAVGKRGVVVETDFSGNMLKIAKEKHSQENIHFVQADTQVIPIKEKVFDIIICFASFPHIPDKRKALHEFYRILKKGGSLIVVHLMGRKELNRFHSKIKGPVNMDYLPGYQEMEELFSSAGFENLIINDEPFLYLAKARI